MVRLVPTVLESMARRMDHASASFGEAYQNYLLLGMMKNRGVVAFVTDGFVRDNKGIRSVGLPCPLS